MVVVRESAHVRLCSVRFVSMTLRECPVPAPPACGHVKYCALHYALWDI